MVKGTRYDSSPGFRTGRTQCTFQLIGIVESRGIAPLELRDDLVTYHGEDTLSGD